ATVLLAGCLVGSVDPTARATELNGVNDGEDYFAYGDSIVAALDSQGSGLAPKGADSFVMWHRNLNDPLASADHNQDGNGQGCIWAKSHRATYTPGTDHSQVFVLAFGNNDPRPIRGGLNATASASCILELYNATHVRRHHIVLANLMPIDPACIGVDYDASLTAQRERVQALEALAARYGVTTWNRYDAIDAAPGNGILDAPDPSLVYDCIHPNRQGHIALAQSLGAFLEANPW
ncbi:MAG TPA: SGNH/GDSL hydrolase family protein, partial [Candidatus Thermoplasmatota archaeon]|nr:SGNH/GDSL hydrolase family protein [Candidatus Thermoplasmatota archaeon]